MADGELNVRVNAEGVEEAAQEFENVSDEGGGLPGISSPGGGGGGGGPGGGGGMLGQLMSSMSGMSGAMMGILGALGLVVGLLATLKPVQKMIEGLFKILQAFVAPLAVMLMRLLSPVLGFLMRLLPIWMDFLSDPEAAIENAMAWLRGALFDAVDMLWSRLSSKLPGWMTDGDGEDVTGTSPTGSGFGIGGNLEDTPGYGASGSGGGGDTSINLFGGLGTFVDRITRDGTVSVTAGPGP